jgi:predicted phage terminase large subunit-like protein
LTLQGGQWIQPREAFYGGAAGGGKSEALLMAAVQYCEVPGYSALILRQTLPDLNQAGALIPRSQEWWGGTEAIWNENKKRWTFPSGAVLRFGYLENRQHLNNYMGSEYQFIGFDEATQFQEDLYKFLFSRLRRRRGMDVPLRVRAASNPGGVGHEWVKRRFMQEGPAAGRVFVPARLTDNPSLDQEEYRASLQEVDPITRAQLLEGDWNVAGNAGNFERDWFPLVDAVPMHVERIIRYWDTASTAPIPGQENRADFTVGTLMAKLTDNTYLILDVIRFQGNPATVERTVAQTAALDGPDVEIFMEQEPGASGRVMIDHYRDKVLGGYYFEGIRSTGSKTVRAAAFGAQAKARNIAILAAPGQNWVTAWLDEIVSFPEGAHDDQVDSAAGAYNQLALGGEVRSARSEIRSLFSWRQG